MNLPQDWAFNPQHTDLDESGRLASGPATLDDWACTVALTTPGTFPQDPAFGVGLAEQLIPGIVGDPRTIGEQIRGALYSDERVGDVTADATTLAGAILLPVRITAAAEPYRLAGPLTPELIEEIIADEDWTL